MASGGICVSFNKLPVLGRVGFLLFLVFFFHGLLTQSVSVRLYDKLGRKPSHFCVQARFTPKLGCLGTEASPPNSFPTSFLLRLVHPLKV